MNILPTGLRTFLLPRKKHSVCNVIVISIIKFHPFRRYLKSAFVIRHCQLLMLLDLSVKIVVGLLQIFPINLLSLVANVRPDFTEERLIYLVFFAVFATQLCDWPLESYLSVYVASIFRVGPKDRRCDPRIFRLVFISKIFVLKKIEKNI